MNEVELLQQLRAELPAVRPTSRAAARARLLVRIESPPASSRPHTAPFWRRPRLSLAVAGLGFAALLIALPIGIFGGSGKVQPALGQTLHQVAEVAASKDPLAPGPGQFLYTRSKGAYLQASGYSPYCQTHRCDREHPWEVTDEWSILVPSQRESWISFDGSRRGRVRAVTGEPRFVSAGQRAGWLDAGSPPLPEAGRVEDTGLSGGVLLDASDLPRDPAKLRELIEAREIRGLQGPPGEAETFTLIGDMLRETYLPSDVRAAVYQLTAELPGVELLGEVRDPIARPGIGIAFADRKRGIRHELIFDPATSDLLAERVSLIRSGAFGFKAPPGTPIGYSAYLESKVVDTVGEAPPAGAGGADNSVGCYAGPSLHAATTVIHDPDPLAACAELWREGIVDTRRGPASPHLVACNYKGSAVTHVFPGSGPAVCRRLGMVAAR